MESLGRCVKCGYPIEERNSCCVDVKFRRCSNPKCSYKGVMFKGVFYKEQPQLIIKKKGGAGGSV